MTYTDRWYRDYFRELQRTAIRKVHDRVFAYYGALHFAHTRELLSTIDLGCATCEFALYASGLREYMGIDLNEIDLPPIKHFVRLHGDFTKLWPSPFDFKPNSFVSLFASELIMPYEERERFYKNIFNFYPTIQTGLVAGLYYPRLADEEYIIEVNFKDGRPTEDPFQVYQTIQRPVQNAEFLEIRMETQSPYTMFGDDCVEVWRIFIRQ